MPFVVNLEFSYILYDNSPQHYHHYLGTLIGTVNDLPVTAQIKLLQQHNSKIVILLPLKWLP